MRYSKILSIALAAVGLLFAASPSASALDPQYYASNSALDQGHWVKIRVTETGMQQVTHEQLRQWGFDDPSKVTVHGFGGVLASFDRTDASMPDDMVAQTVYRTDDRILFYGESNHRLNFIYWSDKRLQDGNPAIGIERNHYADAGYYFLTDCGMEEPSVEALPYQESATEPLTWHRSLVGYEDEVTSPFKVGQHYFGPDIVTNGEVRVTFDLPDRDVNTALGNGIFFTPIVVGAGSRPGFFLEHANNNGSTTKSIQLAAPGTHEYYSTNLSTETQMFYNVNLAANRSQFYFRLYASPSSVFTFAALDRFILAYPRKNRLGEHPELMICDFLVNQGTNFRISEATEDTQVWNVTNPARVRAYETSFDAERYHMFFTVDADYATTSDGEALRVVVFNPAAQQHSVEFLGEVANQNIHGAEVPDMVILTTEICRPEAERLAEIHRRSLGHTVMIVNQEQVFNEFSSGTPSPWGIRRMVKMLHDRNPRMKSLLLFGGGSFDNRGLTLYGGPYFKEGALLLTCQAGEYDYARTSTKSYCADSYYGIVADSPTPNTRIFTMPMDVNVGRISALNAEKARTAVDKIEKYLSNAPDVDITHRVLVLADYGDDNSHMDNSEQTADVFTSIAPGTTTVKLYNSLYQFDNGRPKPLNAAISRALQNGACYVNYNGHGNTKGLFMNSAWLLEDIQKTNYSFYPFAMLATCDAYGFDKTAANLAEEMVFDSRGGMIGVIAATRTVYQAKNQLLNTEVSSAYAAATESTTTGDIYRLARNTSIEKNPTDYDLAINNACYSLCGDPSLPLYAAEARINVESVNGEAYNASDVFDIVPMAPNTITGYIPSKDDAGSVDTSFNGFVILTVYESPRTLRTYGGRTAGEIATNISTDEDVLGQYKAQVTNGRFSVTFTTPAQMRQGDTNRVTLLAIEERNDGAFPAIVKGHFANACVQSSQAPASHDDITAPVISDIYINDPSFRPGDVVGPSLTVYAIVEPDESGIRTGNANIGGNARVVFDGNRSLAAVGPAVSIDSEGRVTISVDADSFNDGIHEVTVIVSDNAGNVSQRSTEFIVMNTPATARLLVEQSTARIEASLSLEHTFSDAPKGRLVIEDAEGNTVFSRANCSFPFDWDLFGADGNPVPDGVYNAYAILSSGLQYATTPKTPIVVVQKN